MSSYILSNKSTYKPGDYIEFNHFSTFIGQGYSICKGKILDCTNLELLEVETISTANSNFIENIVWVSPLSVVEHYPLTAVKHLSVRLLLKDMWKNFIFRDKVPLLKKLS